MDWPLAGGGTLSLPNMTTADSPALLTPEMGPLNAPRAEGAARQSPERSRLLASDIGSLELPLPTWAGDWGA